MRLFLFSAMMLCASAVVCSAESTLDVGAFGSTDGKSVYEGDRENAPVVFGYRHSAAQLFYTPDQLAAMKGKQISEISFKYAVGQDAKETYRGSLEVYLEEKTATGFVEEYDNYKWVDFSRLDSYVAACEVVPGESDGVLTVDLSGNPYFYTGQSLVITVVSDADAGVSGLRFYHNADSGEVMHVLTYGDDNTDFPTSLKNGGNTFIHQEETGNRMAAVPVARFVYSDREAESAFSGGSGTEADPYLLGTPEDISLLDEWCTEGKTNGIHFKLTADVRLPKNVYIGTLTDFYGIFDGGGHCVTVDIDTESGYAALFASAIGAMVKNLQVDGTVKSSGSYVAGVMANPANGTVLENVQNFCDVTASSYGYVGGVAAYIVTQSGSAASRVVNCANYGTITAPDAIIAGGVVGYSGQQVGNEIAYVANYGHISTNSSKAGGLVGNPMYNDQIHDIVNFGTTETSGVAGTVGVPRGAYQNLFYDKQHFESEYSYPLQEKLTSEMTGDGLKNELGEDNWLFADGLLPRLKMNGMENSSRSVLYALPVVLDEENTLSDIDQPFKVGVSGGAKWVSQNGNVFIAQDGSVSLWKEGEDVLVASLDGCSRELKIRITGNAGAEALAADSGVRVSGGIGTVNLTLPETMPVQVFDAGGRVLFAGVLADGNHALPVASGLYFVKCGNAVEKVAVR